MKIPYNGVLLALVVSRGLPLFSFYGAWRSCSHVSWRFVLMKSGLVRIPSCRIIIVIPDLRGFF